VFSLYLMTRFGLVVDQSDVVWIGAVQGLGLGLVFVPISSVAYATLPAHQRTEAASLFSLVRNIGSSIGIAFVTFMLTRNTQVMHAEIAAHVTPYNDPLQDPGVSGLWNLVTEVGRAALNAEITRQATIIAYVDDFKLMMIVALAVLPLVLMIRKVRQSGPGEAVLE